MKKALIIILIIFFVVAMPVQAQTSSDAKTEYRQALITLINLLIKQVKILQAQLNVLQAQTAQIQNIISPTSSVATTQPTESLKIQAPTSATRIQCEIRKYPNNESQSGVFKFKSWNTIASSSNKYSECREIQVNLPDSEDRKDCIGAACYIEDIGEPQ